MIGTNSDGSEKRGGLGMERGLRLYDIAPSSEDEEQSPCHLPYVTHSYSSFHMQEQSLLVKLGY